METEMQRSFNTDIVDDAIFSSQSSEAKLVYFTLYMHPRNHFVGLFQVRPETIALDTGYEPDRVRAALEELQGNGFIETQPDLNMIWVPEMRRVLGRDIGKKLMVPASRYLNGLRPCALVFKVAESLGIPYSGFSPAADRVSRDFQKDGIGSKAIAEADLELEQQPEGPVTTPARVARSVPGFLDALKAIVEGLGGSNAWEALQAPQAASATGLPMNVENGWAGVWRALCEQIPPPSLDDMRKLGRWWAKGGAAKCKKQRFNYLTNVDRITEWLGAARAWDGQSDPTPQEFGERSRPPAAPAGPTGEDPALAEVRALHRRPTADPDSPGVRALFSALAGEDLAS